MARSAAAQVTVKATLDVCPGAYPHTFTGGTIRRVAVDVGGDRYIDRERETLGHAGGRIGRALWRIARVGRVARPRRGGGPCLGNRLARIGFRPGAR
jgi:hypothetical protein